MENSRYLISLGLMETDEKIIQNEESFNYWQQMRQRFSHGVEGLAIGFCIQNKVYDPSLSLTSNSRNPERFSRFSPEKSLKGNFWVSKVPEQLEKFSESISSYEAECKKRSGFFGQRKRFSKAMKNIGLEGQTTIGVYAPSEKIEEFSKSLKKLAWHLGSSWVRWLEYGTYHAIGNPDSGSNLRMIPVERCIVAEATY